MTERLTLSYGKGTKLEGCDDLCKGHMQTYDTRRLVTASNHLVADVKSKVYRIGFSMREKNNHF